MTIDNTILLIKRELIRAFAVLDEWFDKDDALHCFKRTENSKGVRDILEYVMFTTHHLLLTIDKRGVNLFQKGQVENLTHVLSECQFDLEGWQANYDSFKLELPQPMALTQSKQLNELRSELRDHLHRCLCHMELLSDREGVLDKTTVEGNRADVYQNIYLLAQHVKNHIPQLKKIEMEYECSLNDSMIL